ncbi:hypothetical protein [Streptomyces sp. IB201691-2A2]|uniref:hypothetical protein n=1 Tax=Streptomyces sp. IB201691-2A2 TaxID=2561920 RepID=UPI0021B0C31A|nr:hypothetical protein [Streptomyces sp. IB201691-2A2]
MFRTRTTVFAAIAMAGCLLLTACNGEDDDAKQNSSSSGSIASTELVFKPGTARQNNANLSVGDTAADAAPPVVAQRKKPHIRKWVQLSASKAGNLDPVVQNGAGFVLYRFDKDTVNPSASNCFDECAVTWPPYLVEPGGKVFLDGVAESDIGFIKRDGAFQVTIDGSPTYLFSKDVKASDTNGQGVDGTWFGIQPNGERAGIEVTAPEAKELAASKGGSVDLKPREGSAILSDDAGDHHSKTQTVSGFGCVQLPRPKVASSVKANGTASIGHPVTLWSGKGCTGDSILLKHGTSEDLAGQGFDDKAASLFFGGM